MREVGSWEPAAWHGARRMGRLIMGAAVILPLLFTAAPVFAQSDGASPPPTLPAPPLPEAPVRQGPCPVRPDPQWTAAESWTWEKICIGAVADLSERAAPYLLYPAEFDKWPRAERALSAAFLYQILADRGYVEAITFRGVRIRSAWFPELIDLSGLTFNRPLQINRSVFSGPLALNHYRSQSGVDLSECRFDYQPPREPPRDQLQADHPSLDLSQAHIELSLNLERIEAGDVVLSDAVIGQHLMFDGATLYSPLIMNGAQIGGMFWLRHAQLDISLEARLLEVGKDMEIKGTIVARPAWDEKTKGPDWSKLEPGFVRMTDSHIHGNLFIGYGNGVPLPPELDQLAQKENLPAPPGGDTGTGPAMAHDPRFTDPAIGFITGTLDLSAIDVGGEIQIRDSDLRHFLGLEDARAGGDLWLTRSQIADNNLSGVRIGGFLLLQHSVFGQGLFIDSGEIGRHVAMSGETKISGPLYMPGLAIHGSVYADGAKVTGRANLRGAAIDGDLKLTNGTTFEKDIDASFIRIGSSIDLNGGSFGSVDLTGANIGAELRLTAGQSTAQFAGGALLNLSNVEAGSLQDVTGVWPDNLLLVGFNYQRLGGSPTAPAYAPAFAAPVPAAPGSTPAASNKAMAASDCRNRLAAATAGDDETGPYDAEKLLCWLGGQKHFSPAPYTHLADVLRQSGEKEIADAIIYGGKMRQWSETSFLLNPRFFLPWAFTGFGLYPYISGIWVLALIVAGTVIFGLDPSPEMRRFTVPQRVVYSLDMLIPAVHLRHHHAEIELQSWPRFYLYGHKLMGYMLLSFLAAALLGIGGLE